MSNSKQAHKVLAALEKIDPRFVPQPQRHPFADLIEKGAGAVEELLSTAENRDRPIEERTLALDAVGALLEAQGVDDPTAARLGSLGSALDHHPALRAEASRALLRSGHPPFLQAFMARLASEDTHLAAAAAHAMGVAKHKPAVPALIELVAKTDSQETRDEAAWALGRIGESSALEILEAAFKAKRASPKVIEALGQLGTPETAALLTVVLQDRDEEVRRAAAKAIADIIGRSEATNAVQSLRPYLSASLQVEDDAFAGVMLLVGLRRLGADIPIPEVQRILNIDLAGKAAKGPLAQLLNIDADKL